MPYQTSTFDYSIALVLVHPGAYVYSLHLNKRPANRAVTVCIGHCQEEGMVRKGELKKQKKHEACTLTERLKALQFGEQNVLCKVVGVVARTGQMWGLRKGVSNHFRRGNV